MVTLCRFLVFAPWLFITCVFCQPALAQWRGKLVGHYDSITAADDGLLAVPDAYAVVPGSANYHELSLVYENRGVSINGVATAYDDELSAQADNDVLFREAFYDFSLGELDFSVGKKVASWGVAYAFRPLDVVQQEQRLQDFTTDPQGRWLLSVSHFSSDSSIGLFFLPVNRDEQEREENGQAMAFKAVITHGDADWHLVAKADEQPVVTLAAGVSTVIGDGLELHAEAAYLSAYTRLQRRADAVVVDERFPYEEASFTDGKQLLLGAVWTWSGGLGLLVEGWYDQTAYPDSQWREVFDLAREQRALLGGAIADSAIYGNINWHGRLYQTTHSAQYNLFVRFSYSGGDLKPALDFLYTPEDDGLVTRVNLGYSVSPAWTLFASARIQSGPVGSMYGESPIQRLFLAGFELTLNR